jgi:hypothetical protein
MGGRGARNTWAGAILLLSLLGCTRHSDLLGRYVASQNNLAIMLEINAVDGANVSGTVSIVEVQGDGSIKAGNPPFSGSMDNDAMRLNIENGTDVTLATAKQRELRIAEANTARSTADDYARSIQIDQQSASLADQVRNSKSSISTFWKSAISYRNQMGAQATTFQAECQADTLLSCDRMNVAIRKFDDAIGQFERAMAPGRR